MWQVVKSNTGLDVFGSSLARRAGCPNHLADNKEDVGSSHVLEEIGAGATQTGVPHPLDCGRC